MEVMGGNSGFLAVCGGISGGAQICYLPEQKLTLETIAEDIEIMKKRFKHCHSTSLILNNENSSSTYTTTLLRTVFAEESGGAYDVKNLVLGHTQQGNCPSPMDRIRGGLMAQKAIKKIDKALAQSILWVGGVGEIRGSYKATPLDVLQQEMVYDKRVVKSPWWETMKPTLKLFQSTPKDMSYRKLNTQIFSPHFEDQTPRRHISIAQLPSKNSPAASSPQVVQKSEAEISQFSATLIQPTKPVQPQDTKLLFVFAAIFGGFVGFLLARNTVSNTTS